MTKKHKLWALVPSLPKEVLEPTVRQLDSAGLEGIWSPQLFSSPFVPLAASAMCSDKLKLGTGIALAFARSPLETACTALDLDMISGGRAVLGIGPSIKHWNENWYGVEYGKPLQHLREAVGIIRMLIQDGHTGNLGKIDTEYYNLDLSDFKTLAPPLRTDIPLYMPAVFEKSIQAAAELADGLPGHPIWSAKWITEQVEKNLKIGLDRAGKSRADFDLQPWLFCAPNPDKKEAINDARHTIAWYGSMGQYHRYYDYIGFGKENLALQEAAKTGNTEDLVAACPDEMVDAIALAGPPDELRKRFAQLSDIADSFTLTPPFYGLSPEKNAYYSEQIAATFYG
jgi:alkanesulfonate monooxygenase SsuD/methylene tetrahydromethanopterin reductase-like flavin-dependent oxidoreductase (luciferase family)